MAAICLSGGTHATPLAASDAIPIADVQHDGPVDFQKEILPILRRNCLACHNSTDAESDLALETPEVILRGGSEGPAVVAGMADESLLLKLAAFQSEPFMPPPDNDVQAEPLTPQQLGLLKLWIQQGAQGTVDAAEQVVFEQLPPGVNPIYSVAMSPDGQYVASGRANQIFIYHVPTKREVARLTDPGLLESGIYENPGVAHLDLVQSLAFSPDNHTLASGGYRTVKIWQRHREVSERQLGDSAAASQSFAVSPSGERVAIGQQNGSIRIVQFQSGKTIATLAGHTAAVRDLQFGDSDDVLVSVSQDHSLRIWRLDDQPVSVQGIQTPAPIQAVVVLDGGQRLATGHADGLVRIWPIPGEVNANVTDQAAALTELQPTVQLKGHTGPVTSLATFSTDDSQLLSGSSDGSARIWSIPSGKLVRQLKHGAAVVAVAVRADGQRIATSSSSGTTKLWNAKDGKLVAELRGGFSTKLAVGRMTQAVAVAQRQVDDAKKEVEAAKKRHQAEEGNATNAKDARKKSEDALKEKVEATNKTAADQAAAEKAHKANQEALATAQKRSEAAQSEAKKLAQLLAAAKTTLNSSAQTAASSDTSAKLLAGVVEHLQGLAIQEQQTDALAQAVKDLKLALDQLGKDAQAAKPAKGAAQQLVDFVSQEKQGAENQVKQAQQQVASSKKAVEQSDNKVKDVSKLAQEAVDAQTAAKRTFEAATRTAERAVESARKAKEAIPEFEKTVQQLQQFQESQTAALEEAKKRAAEMERPLHALAFSPDGTSLATAGESRVVHLWESETGRAMESLPGHQAPVQYLGFAPGDEVISIATDNLARRHSLHPHWTLQRVIGSVDSNELVDRVTSLAFSRDGTLLATGSGEPSRSGQLKIWNASDGAVFKEINEPHSDSVYGLDFSPDGKHIASCGADRFVKVFSLEDAQLVKSFEGHTHHVLGVSWRADGRVLASCGADKVVKVWDFGTGDQLRTISGFGKEVTALKFLVSADGKSIINLVAACGDAKVYTKNADNGKGGTSFAGSTDFVYSVAVSHDGATVAAGGQDSVLRVWDGKGKLLVAFKPPPSDPSSD